LSNYKIKIGIIFGTRPEAIKLIPVYKMLKKNNFFNVALICTGQHDELVNQVLEFFNVNPDVNLKVMNPGQTLAKLSAKLMLSLEEIIISQKIEGIIVQGDTTSAMIGGLVGFYHKLNVFHIEAGLRSNNKYSPFPEEINRKIISEISDINFTPTPIATRNLKEEGISGDIIEVGNTVVDALLFARKIINKKLEDYKSIFSHLLNQKKKIILITIHRRENYEDHLHNIFGSIKILAKKHSDCLFVFPRHLNPIIRKACDQYFKNEENIALLGALKYDHFLFLMMNSYFIMSDSGGVQEEAPSFNKPVLIIRNNTERPELLMAGGGLLCGTQEETIIENFEKIVTTESVYKKMSSIKNPFGDGNSSLKIEKCIENYFRKK